MADSSSPRSGAFPEPSQHPLGAPTGKPPTIDPVAVIRSKAQLVAGATLLMLSCGWLIFLHDARWEVALAARPGSSWIALQKSWSASLFASLVH